MRKLVKHYSTKIKLPIYKSEDNSFRFDSIAIKGGTAMITGSAGSIYAAENTRIIVHQNGDIIVYGAHDYIEDTSKFDLDLIRDFVLFFKNNIDIEYYNSQPTNTDMVMLSLEDSEKIIRWAISY